MRPFFENFSKICSLYYKKYFSLKICVFVFDRIFLGLSLRTPAINAQTLGSNIQRSTPMIFSYEQRARFGQ